MKFFNDFFYYNKRERNGIIILLALLLVSVLINLFLPCFKSENVVDFSDFENQINEVRVDTDSKIGTEHLELSYFDPNRLSIKQGVKLGFTKGQIKSLHKYVSKGGVFSVKKDFKKMFFVNDSIYNYLSPYIKIKGKDSEKPIKENLPFYFNPNNLPKEYWIKLGFKEWQIRIIKNFENKGGYFKTPKTLGSIYGVDSLFFNKIKPYVITYSDSTFITKTTPCDSLNEIVMFGGRYYGKIMSHEEFENTKKICSDTSFIVVSKNDNINYAEIIDFSLERNNDIGKRGYRKIELKINNADTNEWRKLRGIGSVLSRRIVEYRNNLGGFRSINQLSEVYGIKDSLFNDLKEQLILDKVEIDQININTCDYEKLVAHPYINKNVANSLINYRSIHGNYKKLEDIKASILVNDELYVKIAPYLRLQ